MCEILAFWIKELDAAVCVILLKILQVRLLKVKEFRRLGFELTSEAVKRTTSKVLTTSSRNCWRKGRKATKMLSSSVQRVYWT